MFFLFFILITNYFFFYLGLGICAYLGLTSVQSNDEDCTEIYLDLLKENKLPIRVSLTPTYNEFNKYIEEYVENNNNNNDTKFDYSKPISLSKDSLLSINRLKLFCDGSLGADTAAIKEINQNKIYDTKDDDDIEKINFNESNDDNNKSNFIDDKYRGLLIYTNDELEEKIKKATKYNWRVELHAIGDHAADQVVSLIDKINNEADVNGENENSEEEHNNDEEETENHKKLKIFRPVLTHCQVLSKNIIKKMKKNNIIANIQPSFVPTGNFFIYIYIIFIIYFSYFIIFFK